MADPRPLSRWAVKDAVLAKHCPLTPTQRLVMLALVLRADAETGHIPRWRSPSADDLHDETGLAVSTVRPALDHLVANGWITRERRSLRAAYEYQLASPPATGSLSEPTTGGLSAPTTGAADTTAPTTGSLSQPITVASQPITGAESTDHRRTSLSSVSSTSSCPLPPEFDDQVITRLSRKIDCTDSEAIEVASAVLKTTGGGVRSPVAIVMSRSPADLRSHLDQVRTLEQGRAAREARKTCPDCDDNGNALGGDGLPVDPVRMCKHPGATRWRRSGDYVTSDRSGAIA